MSVIFLAKTERIVSTYLCKESDTVVPAKSEQFEFLNDCVGRLETS